MADDFVPGLEGVIAFETEIAEPDKDGGALRYRGVDIEDLVGKVTFGNVWALLVDGKFGPGLPPAEPFPIPVHSGDVRVDVQAALARVEGARARLALAERAVQADVRRAFEAFDARRQRAALLRGGLLDGADDLLRIARVAYGLDEISLVELLDATDAYREARVAVAAAEAAATATRASR